MYDYKKMFIVGSVLITILFAFVQIFILSYQFAEFHSESAQNNKEITKTAELLSQAY